MDKPIIYQLLPRLWGNINGKNIIRGSLEENGTGKFSDIDDASLEYIRWLGCSHIWYTGVIRHSTKSISEGCEASHPQFVKGEAGSPYSISDYYDVNPYLADVPEDRMSEFHALVDRTHKAGLKVIIDFVPNHVSRDYGHFSAHSNDLGKDDDKNVHWTQDNDFYYYPGQELSLPDKSVFNEEVRALRNRDFSIRYRILPKWMVNQAEQLHLKGDSVQFDEFLEQYKALLQPYCEKPAMATGNNCYSPSPTFNDWYETIKINYSDVHTATWEKMYEIVRFWAGKGVDGFRCDMVELVPPEFFKWMISSIKEEFPNIIFIAEVYQKDLYRKYIRDVGFDYLYDKSGLYDTLRTIVDKNVNDNGLPIELWQSTEGITRNWQYLGDLQPYMLNFLENHDEHRFASDFFGKSGKNSFSAFYVSLFLNRAPFMLYMGEELGERGMDEEGFSGRDGRTTIFDWWSVDSIKKLYDLIHKGLYKSIASGALDKESLEKAGISQEEAEIFRKYSKALQFARINQAIKNGMVYDLCYCNASADGFDRHRHFAFLRDHEDETLLFVMNFSRKDAAMELTIPEHAFEWLELPITNMLNPQTKIRLNVPAMDGVMFKLSEARQ